MSWRSIALTFGIVLLVAGGVLGGLIGLVRHEPAFYQRGLLHSSAERKSKHDKCLSDFINFCESVRNQREWEGEFTETEINGYLDEDFLHSGELRQVLPGAIRAPRLTLQPDRVRLAFRYGREPWSTVVSIDMRPWLVTAEPNVVAVQIHGVYAGALPISAQAMLESVAEAARRPEFNIDLTWYRHEGYPVALLRFQADRPHPTIQLQRLGVQDGVIDIAGRAIEAAEMRAALPPRALRPAAN